MFNIKLDGDVFFTNQLEFINRNNEWCGMPGFDAMLYSFNCKTIPMPNSNGMENDSLNLNEKEKDSLDTLQFNALCAAMNLNRRIVAVHGPPGTGKTHLLIHYLEQLRKQVLLFEL